MNYPNQPLQGDESFFCVTGSLVNRSDSRYLRILWLDNNPNWKRVSPLQIVTYGMAVWYQDKPALMLDNSTICLS